MGIVLVHGGAFAASCWDLVLPHLQTPTVAVDLPGRGSRPADLSTLTLDDFAAAVASDIDATGWDQVLLVGHSLAGVTLPRVVGLRSDVLAGVVFVACTVPAQGQSCADAIDADVQDDIDDRMDDPESNEPISEDFVRRRFGNDLDEEQFAWMTSRMLGDEAYGVVTEPCDLTGLTDAVPRFWVRLAQDAIVKPTKQDEGIRNIGGAEVVALDAGHMAMVGQPEALAAILDDLAGRVRAT
ncbi:MAG TPA: alpha/beta hydrolase [Acidimicrobiales bacterium]